MERASKASGDARAKAPLHLFPPGNFRRCPALTAEKRTAIWRAD